MNKFKLYKKSIYTQKPKQSQIVVVLLIMFGFLFANSAIADIETTVLFQPPPEDEQPEQTEGAASRQASKCDLADLESTAVSTERPNLTALVPQSNHGLTVAERPQFWVYIPETSAQKAFLSIRQEDNTPYWQQSVELTGRGGIMGIQLAENAPALEVGKNYQWAVILVCGDRPNPNDPAIVSWVKRIETCPATPTRSLEQAATYAQQGVWYDALNILIAERSPSSSWQNAWLKYLQSGGLNKIADRPLLLN